MKRGDETKTIILATALQMASTLSLEALTIGTLAKRIQMSKSGLFAHFNSKENLQIEILKYAEAQFAEAVIIPAIKTSAGIPRIKKLVERWINWSSNLYGGCIFVTASTEYADRPGKVRDYLLKQQKDWIYSLMRFADSAIKVGDFNKNMDKAQFAYDLYSMMLGFHYFHQLLRDKNIKVRQKKSLDDLLTKYRSAQG
jgi:AcrR family transcriptional regulator